MPSGPSELLWGGYSKLQGVLVLTPFERSLALLFPVGSVLVTLVILPEIFYYSSGWINELTPDNQQGTIV